MRTREEQISHLSVALFNQHVDIDACIKLARKYILEAERRAEQRVRAEIGRDSERLDWLDKTRFVTLEDAIIGWRISVIGNRLFSMKGTVRQAIDAARELDNDRG
ncbi:hypothetical protein K2X14_11405 [Acetobacter sp. TBRC 12305]|uniref:Uncharacterized protein n=1 Tax=Acetobacter garciniae TaxID=2817435 RepID=A0A939HQ29_9PROT|nr:hypothetical protein [Acetobacter garciniae]MBO1325384.1 hypothetical protein [Acetobacter garciniae]MBX0345444.1 hypothetical protein [Acetobacter garciniae]